MTEERNDTTRAGSASASQTSPVLRTGDATTAVLMELLATFDAQQRRRDAVALAESARSVSTPRS